MPDTLFQKHNYYINRLKLYHQSKNLVGSRELFNISSLNKNKNKKKIQCMFVNLSTLDLKLSIPCFICQCKWAQFNRYYIKYILSKIVSLNQFSFKLIMSYCGNNIIWNKKSHLYF